MLKIPVIGVLTLLRTDLLIRLINSIDYPVENLIILFQGKNLEEEAEKENIEQFIQNKFIEKYTFIYCNMNIGVSRGWNYILRNYMKEYCLISGDDNYFENGTLQKIAEYMNIDSLDNVFIGLNIKRKDNTIVPAGFNSYIITHKIHEKVGLFDENIYPAYFEDDDLWKRIVISGEKTITIPNTYIFSGDDNYTESCTLNSVTLEYRDKMHQCYLRNEIYFYSKWGNNKEYLFPFNNSENIDIKTQLYHENYHENQEILLGHKNEPDFSVAIHFFSQI